MTGRSPSSRSGSHCARQTQLPHYHRRCRAAEAQTGRWSCQFPLRMPTGHRNGPASARSSFFLLASKSLCLQLRSSRPPPARPVSDKRKSFGPPPSDLWDAERRSPATFFSWAARNWPVVFLQNGSFATFSLLQLVIVAELLLSFCPLRCAVIFASGHLPKNTTNLDVRVLRADLTNQTLQSIATS